MLKPSTALSNVVNEVLGGSKEGPQGAIASVMLDACQLYDYFKLSLYII